MYFFELLNGKVMEDIQNRERECSERHLDPRLCGHINKEEIKEALKDREFRSDTGRSV